ncbi:MAG: hypothetical protein ABIR11_12975 [Candidatus Limnocylindrales bacterium]
MPQGTLIWLLVFAVLGLLFLVTARRMSTLIGRTRDLERFQKGVHSLERRLGTLADPFVGQLDEIRRRSGNPEGVAEILPGTQDALRTLAAEGRTLRAPGRLADPAVAFVVELERAVRAADLVEHGLNALLADRGGRDLEAQTSLKRGALNLRHARDAATRIAGEIGAVSPADLVPRPGEVRRPTAAPSMPTYLVDADIDVEGR